jgi:hypothetical protein
MSEQHRGQIDLRNQLSAELNKIGVQESNLLDLAADGSLPRKSIRKANGQSPVRQGPHSETPFECDP